ncbi:MAG: hypothetical protein ACKVOE_09555 [Rickettsiales bacterium]
MGATLPNQPSDEQTAAIVDAFEEPKYASQEEAAYDRILGVSRNAKTGEVEAVLRTKPDDKGQTQLLIRSAADIQRELVHDDYAKTSPGFYDVEMRRAGKKPAEIANFHQANETVLNHAGRMIANAQPGKDTLPTTDEAMAQYNAPGYKPTAVDSDYASKPAFSNEPAYTKTIGIARNMDGEPVALVESAPDKSGKKALVAMTAKELDQQIDHDQFARGNPGMSDMAMVHQARDEGLGMQATDDRIVTLHEGNEKLLTSARDQMRSKVASGATLPSVPEMAQQYQAEQNAPAVTPAASPAPAREPHPFADMVKGINCPGVKCTDTKATLAGQQERGASTTPAAAQQQVREAKAEAAATAPPRK